MKSYMFSVQARSARQNSSTVQCTAVSDTGRSEMQSIRVIYFAGPEILLSESSAVIQNGNLTVTCTATGHPLPSLSVYVVSSDYKYSYYNIPAEQTIVSSNGTKITGALTVARNPNTTVERVSCASNIIDASNGEEEYVSSASRQVFS
ncbi:hypothetical protein PoB_005688500 [Plakobranchus ocellatus]|uniref:Ig-like domain-containing protein n=1 Tax=Plakobranchus ocellatus TaxID=259542 RepID=A0AAV4CF88_9GAST|nr:hypothetical protein PoB_005688500 [Plakobranchus ocellatus]